MLTSPQAGGSTWDDPAPGHRPRTTTGANPATTSGGWALTPRRRPRLIVEVCLVAATYLAYSFTRNAVPDQAEVAIERARWLLRLEQSLQIDLELWANHAVDSVSWLVVGMNYFYATMHFAVTIGVLVWVYHRRPGHYRTVRGVLLATTLLGLVGYYLWALAPPRLLPGAGFIDTVVVHDTWGSLAEESLQTVSNQYAAMPSMHAGWSLWCGLTVAFLARRTWVRTMALMYPLMTLVVIVGTGNHFVLDAVGGWLAVGAGIVLQRLTIDQLGRIRRRPAGDRPHPTSRLTHGALRRLSRYG